METEGDRVIDRELQTEPGDGKAATAGTGADCWQEGRENDPQLTTLPEVQLRWGITLS